MSRPRQENYVFYQGNKFQVEFYFTEDGEMPAKEYFNSADHQVRVKLSSLVEYIAEEGRLFDKTKFRLVNKKEKIYEFKPMTERFFNFFSDGGKIIITNAYHKKGQKVDKRELVRAINLRKDYEFRVKGGDYYETSS